MKYLLLSGVLVFGAQSFAKMSLEEAQQKLQAAQSKEELIKNQLKELEAKIQNTHQALQSVSGKPEYSNEVEKQNEFVRQGLAQHKDLLAKYSQAQDETQRVRSLLGRKFHISHHEGKSQISHAAKYKADGNDIVVSQEKRSPIAY